MKRRIVGLAAILLAALGLLAVMHEPAVSPTPPTTGQAGAADAGLIARGQYLTRAGNCMACHTERGGAAWAGGHAIATPFGTVYGGNLTPDAATGLGTWSSDDFWRALHQGRSRDGRMLYPVFPYPHYTRVTREDTDAMWAYLQTITPVSRANTPHALRWPYGTQAALGVWRALYFREGAHQDEPGRTPAWNRGAYLVQGLGHCSACHSARDNWGGSRVLDLSGGMIPMQAWYAPSLTAADQAGVAQWEISQIVQLLSTGTSERASTLGPMAQVVLHSTQHLTGADLQAMAVFLQALPPTGPSPATGARAGLNAQLTRESAARGARLYGEHCAQCHGDEGQGVPPAYPRLAGNRAVTMDVTANLVQVVLHGGYPPATTGQPRPFGMPPYALVLSDAEVAAVLTHLRSAWGHRAAGVSELDVAQQRSGQR